MILSIVSNIIVFRTFFSSQAVWLEGTSDPVKRWFRNMPGPPRHWGHPRSHSLSETPRILVCAPFRTSASFTVQLRCWFISTYRAPSGHQTLGYVTLQAWLSCLTRCIPFLKWAQKRFWLDAGRQWIGRHVSTRGDHLSFLVVGEAGQENLSKGSEGASKTTHVATLLPFTEKGASLCFFSRVLACLMDTFGSMHSFLVTNLNKRPEPKQWLVAHRGASPGRSSECELQLGGWGRGPTETGGGQTDPGSRPQP